MLVMVDRGLPGYTVNYPELQLCVLENKLPVSAVFPAYSHICAWLRFYLTSETLNR